MKSKQGKRRRLGKKEDEEKKIKLQDKLKKPEIVVSFEDYLKYNEKEETEEKKLVGRKDEGEAIHRVIDKD